MVNEEILNMPLKCTRFWTTGMYRMSGKYKYVKKGPDKQILKYNRKIRPAIYPIPIVSNINTQIKWTNIIPKYKGYRKRHTNKVT